MQIINILIGGDLAPTKNNSKDFINGNVDILYGSNLMQVLQKADFRIFNLETPLTNDESPLVKCGPNLIAPTDTIKGIKTLNPTLMSLANNHILDHGEQGLRSTIKVLEQNNVSHVGAGLNFNEALQPFILEKDGIKVGVYACAEHEFTIATNNSAGANPFDPLESLDHIKSLSNKCDYTIVLYHGGKEHYRYPSPYLQKVCRKMIDNGADLIVCQHSHCIGTFEKYNKGTIIYGQGNFLFDGSDNELWQTSLLLDVTFSDKKLDIEYIPIVKNGCGIKLATGQEHKQIIDDFLIRSTEILDETFVQKEYKEFAKQMINGYLSILHGRDLIFKVLNKLCGHTLATKLYSKRSIVAIQNIIECEAHRELVIRGLKEIIKEKK